MAFLWRRIREVGGFRNAFWDLLKLRDLRAGTLIGRDEFGNKYYQNNEYFFGRHRWVYYVRKDYDASQIPPEWHRWLHYMTDRSPVEEPPEPKKFALSHQENVTGTEQEYIPYSTTRPKIESWQPPKASQQS